MHFIRFRQSVLSLTSQGVGWRKFSSNTKAWPTGRDESSRVDEGKEWPSQKRTLGYVGKGGKQSSGYKGPSRDQFDDRIEEWKIDLYKEAKRPSRFRNVPRINELVAEMLNECPPRMHLYNVLLHTRIMLNDVQGIEDILALIKENQLEFNLFTYNLLVTYYRNSGCPQECEKLLEQMMAAGLTPNRFTYTTLITAYAKIDLAKAKKYFDIMKGGQKPYEQPDLFAYNAMIASYLHFLDYVEADTLVQEMGNVGIEPNCVTYEVLIEGLSKGKRFKDAWVMYETLMSSKISPTSRQLEDICQIFWRNHNNVSASRVLQYLEENFDSVDAKCVAPAVNNAIYQRKDDIAGKLLERHVLPNLHAYSASLKTFREYAEKYESSPQIVDMINGAISQLTSLRG
jgi:pentatricopeptide repeat protein